MHALARSILTPVWTHAGESIGENRVYFKFTVLHCKGPDQDWTSPTGDPGTTAMCPSVDWSRSDSAR